MKRCSSQSVKTRIPCMAEATHMVAGGCVHEHVTTVPLCDEHTNHAEQQADWVCCAVCHGLVSSNGGLTAHPKFLASYLPGHCCRVMITIATVQ